MKLLTIIASVIVIAAMGAAGTWAVYTNQETSTGNTFQVGQLDIYINGRDTFGNMTIEGNPPVFRTYFNVPNMTPGKPVTAYIEVKNSEYGSMDALFRIYLDNVVQSPSSFADQLQVVVTLNPSGYTHVLGGNLYGNPDTVIYSGPLSGIIGINTPINNLNLSFNQGQPFHAEWLAIYKIKVTLPSSTGNAYQGATLTGNMVVNATQLGGQNPSNIIWSP